VPTGLTAVAGDCTSELDLEQQRRGGELQSKALDDQRHGEVTITNVISTSYTDTGLANGTKYYYKVSATNSSGESANSSEVSATPSRGHSVGRANGDNRGCKSFD
jgi:hypothetical protein